MKNFDVNCPPRGLVLGYAGENIARGQAFDFTAWAEEYGAGSLQVVLQRPGDAAPYPVALTVEGTVATWLPTETDLQEAGTGQLQLIYTVGEVRVKTLIVSVLIGPSLGSSGETPAPGQAWIDQLTDLAAETEQHAANAAESARNAAASAAGALQSATDAGSAKTAAVAAAEAAAASASHYPQIVGGVWYVWSPTAGEYISTGIDAQGEDGVSPTVEITAIQGGHRVVITDAAGPHTFDVLDGVTPDLSAYRTAADQDVIDDAQDDQIADLKSALNTKAGILRDTVSGSVASFVPDSTVPNLLGLSVALEPIQDLHGYDSPWPAGGGKNKFDPSAVIFKKWRLDSNILVTVQDSSSVVSVSVDGEDITISNTIAYYGVGFEVEAADADRVFSVPESIGGAVQFWSAYEDGATRISTGSTSCVIPANASGFIAFRHDVTRSVTTKAQLESGSTATAWTPYSNLCPISGRESVGVDTTGINIWDEEWELGYYTSTGEKKPSSGNICSSNPIPVIGGETYYCKSPYPNGLRIMALDVDGQVARDLGYIINAVFTIPDAAVSIVFYTNGADVITDYSGGVSVNYPSTDHDYHPYVGTTHTIQLGDTVYGGDIGIISGEGESIWRKTQIPPGDLRAVSASYDAETTTERYFIIHVESAGSGSLGISNMLKKGITGNVNNAGVFSFDGTSLIHYRLANSVVGIEATDDRATRNAKLSAYLTANPIEIVYQRKTPIPISTTPTEISTVEGPNNVFSPDGDVTVEYAADLKTYIDSKIAAAVAALS